MTKSGRKWGHTAGSSAIIWPKVNRKLRNLTRNVTGSDVFWLISESPLFCWRNSADKLLIRIEPVGRQKITFFLNLWEWRSTKLNHYISTRFKYFTKINSTFTLVSPDRACSQMFLSEFHTFSNNCPHSLRLAFPNFVCPSLPFRLLKRKLHIVQTH